MKYEPIYIKDYLRSFPTLKELWETNLAEKRSISSLTLEENRHLHELIREYRISRENENQQKQKYHMPRDKGEQKRQALWDFCAKHGLPNIVYTKSEKKGVLDLDGNMILPATYDAFLPTEDNIEQLLPINYFVCKKDGKWGVVNSHNKVCILFEYDNVFRLVGHPYLFYVEKDGKKGLVKLTPNEELQTLTEQQESMTFLIPCEMDEIYFIEHEILFVFRQVINGEDKYGWVWETTEPNPKSFSPCIYDQLYIPTPCTPENPISYEDAFFEARKGNKFEYVLIWTHRC